MNRRNTFETALLLTFVCLFACGCGGGSTQVVQVPYPVPVPAPSVPVTPPTTTSPLPGPTAPTTPTALTPVTTGVPTIINIGTIQINMLPPLRPRPPVIFVQPVGNPAVLVNANQLGTTGNAYLNPLTATK